MLHNDDAGAGFDTARGPCTFAEQMRPIVEVTFGGVICFYLEPITFGVNFF